MRTRQISLGMLLVAAASGGCATLDGRPGQRETRVHAASIHRQELPLAAVDVGGLVAAPQAIEIPAAGLTLLQAIIRAGDVRPDRDGGVAAEPPPLFAVLCRTSGLVRQTHYLPISLLRASALGDIPLRPGDTIQVLRVEETRLLEERTSSADARYSLAGLVANPGIHPVGDSARLVHLTEADRAGEFARWGATMVTLTRRELSGSAVEHFYLPTSWLAGDEGDAFILPNDEITFTTLERLPLVQAARIASVQRGRELAQQGRRALEPEVECSTAGSSIPGIGVFRQAGASVMGRFGR